MGLLESLVKSNPQGKKDTHTGITPKSSDEFATFYPNVYDLMTKRKIGAITRELSKLSVKLADTGWVTTLTEPASGQVLFSQSDSLFKAFEALESRIVSPEPDWREDRYAKKKKTKK